MNKPKDRRMLRIATGLTVVTIFLVLMWTPGLELSFALFIIALCAVGLFEYYAIVRARAISPETIGGILAGTAIAFTGYFHNPTLTNFALYGGCLLVASLHIVRGQHSVAGLASTVFGIFYVGWFGAHVIFLHRTPAGGPGLVFVLFVAVVLTDTAAYFVGSAIGKHKMAPKVSPNKSWEGAAAGFLFSVLGLFVLSRLRMAGLLTGLPEWTTPQFIHAGAVLSITSQVGDLAESCLKRDAGVKDSGSLFPGHGGVLDRCDGFLFAAPVLYYMTARWFVL